MLLNNSKQHFAVQVNSVAEHNSSSLTTCQMFSLITDQINVSIKIGHSIQVRVGNVLFDNSVLSLGTSG